MRRIGIVMPFAKGDSEGEARIRAFEQELAKLGWSRRKEPPHVQSVVKAVHMKLCNRRIM
jgi:hypothetical protein